MKKNLKNQHIEIGIFFLFCILLFSTPNIAEAATLYLTPQSQAVYQGDSFIVEVRIDTVEKEINAAKVSLTFPSDLLETIDLSKGNSVLTLWAEEPKLQEREISFAGGVPGGFNGDGLLAKITFLGKEIGELEINFKEDSKVLLNDGKGTPAEVEFRQGNYEIIKKPKNLPVISSQSHPDQNKWYSNTTLELYWDLVEGAEYSYLLSYDSLAEPDEIPDKPEGELMWIGAIKYEGLKKDAIYYFTLKQKLADENWSEKITYRAMIDTAVPEPFELKIGKDPSIFKGKYFLSFAAQDKMSGIDYYEIKEGKEDWKRIMSPCLLEDQSLGKKITVRAYDKTGNYQESEIKPPLKTTWKDWLHLVLVLIGMGVIWWLIKRFKK